VGRSIISVRRAAFVLLAVALLGISVAAATASRSASSSVAAKAPAAKWKKIVAAAKKEGKVVLYTSQNPATLAVMADNFKKKYGISVTVNRNIDNVLTSQVGNEISSGKRTADILVVASRGTVIAEQRQHWSVPAVGPDLHAAIYDRSALAKPGNAFIVGHFPAGIAWNTQLVKGGIKGIKDFTKPALKGRFGMPQPSAASFIDWYLWLQETYGKGILAQLAANKPKIYLSSLTILQAVEAGELSASPFTPATALDDRKNKGAPVNWKLPLGSKSWNAPFWADILKGAPHPNAAQLLANYMVTKAGMGAAMHLSGAVIKGIPLTYYAVPRTPKLLTPKQVADFQANWNKVFK
jgi:iron(III) transport system substrate-binding protein